MAVAAVDVALWDLKARLLGAAARRRPRREARARRRSTARGGFTSYSFDRLREPARRLGRGRHPAREDEGRARPGPRPGARRARPARRSAPTPSSTSTRTAPSRGSRRSRGPSGSRRVGRALVRRAGLLRRSRRTAPAPRPRPCRARHRGRRVRLRRCRLRARSAGAVDCPPGGRDPLRRDHRALAGRRRRDGARARCSRAIARPRSRPTRSAPSPASATSSTSTTTCGSRHLLFDGVPEVEEGGRAATGPVTARPRLELRSRADAVAAAPAVTDTRPRQDRLTLPDAAASARSGSTGSVSRASSAADVEGEVRFSRGRPRPVRDAAARTTARCRSAS